MTANCLATRLRRDTHTTHTALEASLPIGRKDANLGDYRDYLRFLLSVHEPLEARLRRVPGLHPMVPDLDERWKSRLLRSDLGASHRGPRPAGRLLPSVLRPAPALGILYVLEGATLGAQILAARLRANGVIPGPIGSTYLTVYGTRTVSMWRTFAEALGRVGSSTAEAEVVRGACSTFASLLEWRREWVART